ncbi:MAG: tripartite tricarboxylate transporter substrate binding protein [Betaproteobacteria bacterium]|nr:tripartite tricarboxylate transporter substrate binding protein [Betaproteobacteria bacterium]
MMNFTSACCRAAVLALLLPCALAGAQAYPTKPIRLIVAFPPGGSTDIIARIVGQKLGERLNQQVVIDNRGGAGGTIGTEIAARANPDGYTLTMGTTSTHVIAAGAYAKLKYDPVKDFEPLTLVATTPYLLVVNPGVKANSLKEFIELAKSQPGKLNYASAGTGTTTQLAMEMLKTAAGIDVVHVPYNGNGPANTATLGGQVQALFGSMPAVLTQAKAGRLRPLAVGTPKRSPSLPDVPSVAESGFPGFDASLWLGFFAPKGTSAPILKRLQTELTAIAKSPEMKEQFERNGAEPLTNTPAEFTQLIKAEIDKYTKVIKAAGIKLE